VQQPPAQDLLRIWRFGNAVLDERSLELSVDGRPVALERKQLQILIFLLQHAGEVIYKHRLVEAVWPGRAVTDSNLTKCIAVLRHALGDESQTMIKTAHGFGYRLAAPVQIESAQPASLLPDAISEISAALTRPS
jgi:eukaryotic-like serine/threonine-protein kinase